MTLLLDPPTATYEVATGSVDHRPAPLFSAPPALILIGAVAITSAGIGVMPVQGLPEVTRTSVSAPVGNSNRQPEALSPASLLRRIRENAGLTWDQLARVFGVSRRSVHNWAAGENMSAHNLELVGRLDRLVNGIDGETPDAKRTALFTAAADGASPMDVFRQMVSNSGINVNSSVASQRALLGVE